MTVALLLLLLGVTSLAAGAGYEWGWGWAGIVAGLALLACGLLYDFERPDQEVP